MSSKVIPVSISERLPARDQKVIPTARDQAGTYEIPFPCRFDGSAWRHGNTGKPMVVPIVAWRPVTLADVGRSKKPGRLTFNDTRSQVSR